MQRVAAVPGVRAVGGVGNLFFLDEARNHALRIVQGYPPEPKSLWKPLVWTQVSGNYFEAMGTPLLRGPVLQRKRPAGFGAGGDRQSDAGAPLMPLAAPTRDQAGLRSTMEKHT
jgi:hypothetical protein